MSSMLLMPWLPVKRKPTRIIEYQPDIQRTPLEVLEFLKDEIEKGNATHIIALYRSETGAFYTFGSEERDYKTSEIYWDFAQWAKYFV